MDRKLRFGFSGAGWMGEQFILNISRRDDAELVAVYDANPKSAGKVLQRAGLSTDLLTSSYEELVNDRLLDAVMIASPNSAHARQSLDALANGLHVFSEKPNATTWSDHRNLVEADAEHPMLVTVTNYTLYFNEMEQRIKRMIERNSFGEIIQLQVNYRHSVNTQGDKVWKYQKRYVGDALGMGITHAIFLLCYFMSPSRPEAVFARSRSSVKGHFEVDPIWNLIIQFDGGATGIVLGDIENGTSYDLYHNIYGTRGGLVFDSQARFEERLKYWNEETKDRWYYPLGKNGSSENITTDSEWPADVSLPTSGDVLDHSTVESLGYFITHIKKRSKALLGFKRMRIVQDVSFAAQLSAKVSRPVPIPADEEELQKYLG